MTASIPPSRCPAQHGKGADIRNSYFMLVVDDCCTGPDGQPSRTEIFGFFRREGEEHDNDALLTACLEVPADSPVAQLARLVGSGWKSRRIRRVARELRRNIEQCPCTATADCPALDEIRLFEAIEHALAHGSPQHRSAQPGRAYRDK
jgi:hypothetical protein